MYNVSCTMTMGVSTNTSHTLCFSLIRAAYLNLNDFAITAIGDAVFRLDSKPIPSTPYSSIPALTLSKDNYYYCLVLLLCYWIGKI